jgi:hypothetical protein
VLRYPLAVTHVAIVAWVRSAQDGLVADDRLLAVAQELATRAGCASSLFVSAGKQVA